ncbi:hypothetical protein Thal_0238 [Thermocrinis albus DSM 14484]|uniref:Flagellar assembly protein FliH/Type III secretion system HrpE domain-containing protein n=1 Tax=Thermocrinis albus (strain DSM 14484 / JCM 11386 / HI 11/12) TaxID=638303 RepID=D3SNY6_THEAH|nr:FliH/SctL family protein [Thermocrinis albus]ADC88873.1 hypothetical protein Thal_0238 [Thermocrinis albus DSM 14484]
MSEDFVPIHPLHAESTFQTEPEEHRGDKELLEEELIKCKEEVQRLTKLSQELKKDKELAHLQVEELREEVNFLKEQLRKVGDLNVLVERLGSRLREELSLCRRHLTEELLSLVEVVVKELLITDVLPREEALLKALSSIFESYVKLKGRLVIHLNPADVPVTEPYLRRMVQQLDGIELQIREDLQLMRGEFVMETPQFWIERRYEDLLQDLLGELRGEKGI